MSASPDASPPRRAFDVSAWLPSGRSLLWILAAFGAGLLLFLLLVGKDGSGNDFYRTDADAPAAAPRYTALPVPLAGGEEKVGNLAAQATEETASGERPRLVETGPSLPEPTPAPVAVPVSAPPVSAATSEPQPISMPAPKYPARALRRGEGGTVTVSVRVDADGIPASVEVATSSGSRSLDRAAVKAVRRWRFRPALAEGRPVAGEVRVPITFKR